MIEYFKQRVLGHPSRGVEDAESNINYDDLAQEISKGKNISKYPKHHSYHILLKNVTIFCPCPKKSSWGQIEEFWLMVLAETSTQPSTDFVLWLLVVSRANL